MIKEKVDKIKALVVKENGKDKKKIENLVFFLVISVITLIAVNFIFKDDKKEIKNNVVNSELVVQNVPQNDISIRTGLEENLENILSRIKGVGEVEVLITYSQSSKITPMYNETSNQSITEESDNTGGTRKIESYDTNKQVVSDSNSNPITEKVTLPQIEGAVVIAKGASNTTVKNNIIAAVEAATGLSSHKIQVFEMKGE
ncbi:MAG: hypothetical protein IKF52_04080 [Clostridia bacterium]|nr:hypothetical protein [Clostridia bacterium]